MTTPLFFCCESERVHKFPHKNFLISFDSTCSCYFFLPGDSGVRTTAVPPLVNTTFSWTLNSTQDPSGNGTTGNFIPFGTSVTTALTNTSSVTYNSSRVSLATSMSSASASPLPATTCSKKYKTLISTCS